VDGGAASSGPQVRGAASDGLINRFYVAHPEKPLLGEVPAVAGRRGPRLTPRDP